jgi:hypothetical protein
MRQRRENSLTISPSARMLSHKLAMSGRRPLTRETYEKLLSAYREHPANANHAATAARCSWQLARRAWSGPPYRDYPWATPIKQLLDDERRAGLARAHELQRQRARDEAELADAEHQRAREAAIEARAQEQQALKLARGDVLSSLALAAELVPSMRQLTRVVQAACAPKADGSPPDISPVMAMGLLGKHAALMAKAVSATETVIELSRLERGQPTAIVGMQPQPALTYEQAVEELEEASELLKALKARGMLPGGTLLQ